MSLGIFQTHIEIAQDAEHVPSVMSQFTCLSALYNTSAVNKSTSRNREIELALSRQQILQLALHTLHLCLGVDIRFLLFFLLCRLFPKRTNISLLIQSAVNARRS